MEINVSSTSTALGSAVATLPTIPIVEEKPEMVSMPILVNQPKNKQTRGRVTNPEMRSKVNHDDEAFSSGYATIFPGCWPPWKDDAQHVKINKNMKYMLIEPAIPKGFHVKGSTIDNLKKLAFYDHDLLKYKEF